MLGTRLCIGILAHVDAGKTTLSEALLYTTGNLRKLGRVDHRDAFLDNFSQERERGITIFSKQANLSWEGLELCLLDTPGHVDFSAEMERTLSVLDYCILVISGADGVQGHTATLWKLLKQYRVPTFLFVNKMDQPGTDREALLAELQNRLSGNIVAFDANGREEGFLDALAMCNETMMESFLEQGDISQEQITAAVTAREVFPCFFGSALKLNGIEELLDGLKNYTEYPEYPDAFGARVFKISRDSAGNRLTHIKITGGILKTKMMVGNAKSTGNPEDVWEEKVDAIRLYAGAGFTPVPEMAAGGVCAVTGLSKSYVGQGLGLEKDSEHPLLVPVMTYRVLLPEGADPVKVLAWMRQLEEEEPLLNVVWKERSKEIHVQVMGTVQTEILKSVLEERYGLEVEFTDGNIVYQETIETSAEGIGHYEPLRHYAEVHLLLEPGEPGSGIVLQSTCSEDDLDKNWQRLIFTHLEEKVHLGVLTGSPITDICITLLNGRAHIKHTEGGDFRQATYRAVRHGLMHCKSRLLEPVYSFTMELPTECLGRAMSDVKRLFGDFDPPETGTETSILTGKVPVATFRDYQRELNTYSRGKGRLSCTLRGYEPCHNQEEVLAASTYDPDSDLENPASSVFCAHGAGFVVDWPQVAEYAHVDGGWNPEGVEEEEMYIPTAPTTVRPSQTGSGRNDYISNEEIDTIFRQTYRKGTEEYEPYRYHKQNTGGIISGRVRDSKAVQDDTETKDPRFVNRREKPIQEGYFLVDGYNIIFAWEELKSLATVNIDSARDKLMDICCNFQGYNGDNLILVFDAYKVKGNPGSVLKYHNIHVVYTKEAETADQYIEKTVHKIAKNHRVTVATSDALEQMIIWGAGALRLSARGFYEEVQKAKQTMREEYPTGGSLRQKVIEGEWNNE